MIWGWLWYGRGGQQEGVLMIPMDVIRTVDMTWLEYWRLCEVLYAEQIHGYDG